jgi:UDP-glucose 4-epimerase
MARTALVTGGAGFIGSHLVSLLLREGWTVRVLDNFSTGTSANLLPVLDDIEILMGDIRQPDQCREACVGVDSVFHMAAIASVAESVTDPLRSHDVNLTGTVNLLRAARDAGVRRFVFSSSASVYGNAETVPTRECDPLAPLSPYASTKASGEFYCRNFFGLFGMEAVILRYFNVFGPRQSMNSGYAAAIPRFVHAAVNGESPIIFGDGLQTRDFIYVENVAAANLRAAVADGVGGMTFNVAAGEAISLLDLLAELRNVTGASLEPRFQEARAGDVRHSRADVSEARRHLGFEPAVSFAEGIRRTVEGATVEAPRPRILQKVA